MKTVLLSLAEPFIKSWRVAIDGGAHRGKWTVTLSKKFARVYAFEPQAAYASKLSAMQLPGVRVINAALMETTGMGSEIAPPVNEKKPFTNRSTTIVRDYAGSVRIVRLDDFAIQGCGLIKLNVEGCEPLVLEGAVETLNRWSPVVIMEEAHHKNLPEIYKKSPKRARTILEHLGYREVGHDSHDTIWSRGRR